MVEWRNVVMMLSMVHDDDVEGEENTIWKHMKSSSLAWVTHSCEYGMRFGRQNESACVKCTSMLLGLTLGHRGGAS